MKKNRILLDNENLQEELIEVQEKKSNKYLFLIGGGIFLLILFIFLAGLYYYNSKKIPNIFDFKKQLPDISSELKEKYYYPKEITPALEKGISYYREGFFKQSREILSVLD